MERIPDLKELKKKIKDLHLVYLDSERHESLRAKLISYVKEFLCYIPNNYKFKLEETREVFRRNVIERSDFSGYRAARAWSALAKYADNLLVSPWRKEYQEIKLYGGFYKHHVESGLLDAHIMLEAIGYQFSNKSSMKFEGILDPDQITSVSLDALFAEVECMIMDEVWKQVEGHGCSWVDILKYREQYIGGPDKIKTGLLYYLRYKTHHQLEPIQNYNQKCHQLVDYGPPPYISYNNGGYVANHILPHSVYSPYPYAPCPVVNHPGPRFTNNYNYHYMYEPSGHNVCHQPRVLPPSYFPSTVPTAQLIELEPSVYNHHTYPSLPDRDGNSQFLSSKAKDDGAGQWEAWDSVFKQTKQKESNSSKYDDHSQLSERMRGINLAQPNTASRRYDSTRTEGDGAVRSRVNKSSFELEDAVPMHRLTKNSSESECDAVKLKKTKRKDDDYFKSTNVEIGEKKQGRSLAHNEFTKKNDERELPRIPELNSSRALKHTNIRELDELQNHTNCFDSARGVQSTSPLVVTLDVSPQFLKDVSPVVDLPPETWECTTCTYLNTARLNICEMCAKSRVSKDIKHPPGGGRECPNCTLVNDRNKNFCVACNNSLKDSPTYI